MKIIIYPVKEFYQKLPKYNGLKCVFLGWEHSQISKWGNGLIKVKFGKKRVEFLDICWFKDLIIK